MSDAPARPYIGGQAVIEGVMMRSPGSMSIVCRRRSGELVVRERPVPTRPRGARNLPLIRGIATVVESLRMGSAALRWSTELFTQDLEDEENAKDAAKAAAKESAAADANESRAAVTKVIPRDPGVLSTLALGVVTLLNTDPAAPAPAPLPDDKKGGGILAYLPVLFAIGLFVALPQASAEGINKLFKLGLEVTSPAFQAITGASKLTILVTYLLLIRRIPEIYRVFQYHGAEHKTISTWEAEEELVVPNARAKTTMHPRCGTTLLVMVALVSILVFSLVGAFLPHIQGGRLIESVGFFFVKLPFLPVIAAITYEIQRLTARYCTTGPLRALLWPGFLVQKITTAEPNDDQLEVALASLRATLWREEAIAAPIPEDRTFAGYGELLADPGYARAA